MTRRPPMPPDGNIRRAHQRMAPGGRLWSESPVRGPAVRVVAAGDDPPVVVPPDLALYYRGMMAGENVVGSGVDMFNPANPPSVGDHALSFVAARDAAIALPTGYTVLESGTYTDITWVAAWRVVGAADDWIAEVTPPFAGGGLPYQGYGKSITFVFQPGVGVPSVLSVTETTGTVVTPTYPAGLSHSVLVFGKSPVADFAPLPDTRPDNAYMYSDVVGFGYGIDRTGGYNYNQDPLPFDPSPVFTWSGYSVAAIQLPIGWSGGTP